MKLVISLLLASSASAHVVGGRAVLTVRASSPIMQERGPPAWLTNPTETDEFRHGHGARPVVGSTLFVPPGSSAPRSAHDASRPTAPQPTEMAPQRAEMPAATQSRNWFNPSDEFRHGYGARPQVGLVVSSTMIAQPNFMQPAAPQPAAPQPAEPAAEAEPAFVNEYAS